MLLNRIQEIIYLWVEIISKSYMEYLEKLSSNFEYVNNVFGETSFYIPETKFVLPEDPLPNILKEYSSYAFVNTLVEDPNYFFNNPLPKDLSEFEILSMYDFELSQPL